MKTSKALDLFSRCVKDLVDADNFKTIYLHNIKLYVNNTILLEEFRDRADKDPRWKHEYNALKKIVNRMAKDSGYPKLEDLDKPKMIETKKKFTGLKVVR